MSMNYPVYNWDPEDRIAYFAKRSENSGKQGEKSGEKAKPEKTDLKNKGNYEGKREGK